MLLNLSTHSRVRKLAQIAGELSGGANVPITRLTTLKSLCEAPEVAAHFAVYLAKQVIRRATEGASSGQPSKDESYNDLITRSVERLGNYVESPPAAPLAFRYNPGYTSSMKTAISIPDKLFESGEQFARGRGMSRSELYATALRRYLEEHRSGMITERLDEIYGVEPGALDPEIARLQTRSLPEDEW